MRYLLNTNVWIFYLKNQSSLVGTRLRNTPANDIVVCSVVRAELLHGARKYEKRTERVARVELTLSPFISLPFDDAAAGHYATIRDDLELRGITIGSNDLMIAAIAVTHGLTLVSNNCEFNRVGGMPVEDWTIG
jgi:tRNA(fMet)-specific endonuclease VapC